MWKTLKESKTETTIKKYLSLPEGTRKDLEANLPRKDVEQRCQVYSDTFPEIHKAIREFAKKWKKTEKDVYLDHYLFEDYGSTRSQLDLCVQGLETDEQYYRRLMEHHESNVRREKWERQEFERLKSKFNK